jgi:hypothetical protein
VAGGVDLLIESATMAVLVIWEDAGVGQERRFPSSPSPSSWFCEPNYKGINNPGMSRASAKNEDA